MRMTKELKNRMMKVIESGISAIEAEGIWDNDECDYITPEWTYEVIKINEMMVRLRLV
jgi:hypothetical protein